MENNIGENFNETSKLDSNPEVEISLKERDAKIELDKKKKDLAERNESKEAAKKIDADPNLKYNHPLMNCEMNLMEISHRVVEKIEKAKYRIVGKSEGDIEADKKEFAKILVDELIKFN